MWISNGWKDYQLLDCGGGERLERWGSYILVRPDPQAIWPKTSPELWRKYDARYSRSSSGGGAWDKNGLPPSWQIGYRELTFNVKAMNFKHTGIFPEQATNWDWFSGLIKKAVDEGREINVLNLFAYTGGATIAASAAGARVCHVDAAKGMVAMARENAASSGVTDRPIRWIVDDCGAFIDREIRRGRRYDGIIMDPPSYGRGPSGEVWKLEDEIAPFVKKAAGVLSDDPLFFLVNSYSTGLSPSTMEYIVASSLGKDRGVCVSGELGLPVRESGLALPCGASVRWSAK